MEGPSAFRGGIPLGSGTTYKAAGVDIDAADRLVSRIRQIVKPTLRPEVMTDVGGFGAAAFRSGGIHSGLQAFR